MHSAPSAPPANRQPANCPRCGHSHAGHHPEPARRFTGKTSHRTRIGTSGTLDAFFAANRLSEILFNLVAGGALGSAFIPVFTTFLSQGDRKAAWKLASAIANLVVLILTILAALGIVFAPWIVKNILAPGFTDPSQQQLAVDLLRILLPSTVIFGLSGLVMGVLNSHQVFLIPALAPAMYSLGWIFGVIFLAPSLGVYGLAWGTVLGAVLHLVLQLPKMLGLPGREFTLSLGLDMPAVAEVARLMAPRLLGVAFVQLNFLLNTYLASSQPEGSISGINLAFPLMLMPQAAIAQSIAIAALPTFSAQVALGNLKEMRSSLAATLRGVLILAIPASIGLILLREQIVSLIYQGGEFGVQSSQLVSWALLWYAAGLVGHSVVEIVSRAFYALHNTLTPVLVGVAAMSLNLFFSILFSNLFEKIGWMPHGGLALANSLATFIEMGVLLFLMKRSLNGLEGKEIWGAAGKACLGALCMSLVILLWLGISQDMPVAAAVLGGVVLGGLVYLLVMVGLKTQEIQHGWQMIRSRLRLHS